MGGHRNILCKPFYFRMTRGCGIGWWCFSIPADLMVAMCYMFVVMIWCPLSYIGWGVTNGWNRRVNFSPGIPHLLLHPWSLFRVCDLIIWFFCGCEL
jgi:hypothetical protein